LSDDCMQMMARAVPVASRAAARRRAARLCRSWA
jgi:hypothetical protein